MDERPAAMERDLEGDPESDPESDPEGDVDASTGVAEVDRVLADVAAVSGTPVAEHVAVFERAHDQLRRALDAHPGPRPGPQQGA